MTAAIFKRTQMARNLAACRLPARRLPGRLPRPFFRSRLVIVVLAVLMVAAVDPIFARASMLEGEPEPTEQIDGFHAKLLVVMQNAGDWDFAKRRSELAPEIAARFDTTFMSRIASGRYWKRFSNDQKRDLSDAFRAFTLANYAFRFNGYSGQVFEMLAEEPQDARRTFVRTRILRSNGDPVRIDYLLMKRGGDSGGWKIIDIYVEGRFSELAVRRSEFAPILRDQGFDGLLQVLKAKVEEIEAEAESK